MIFRGTSKVTSQTLDVLRGTSIPPRTTTWLSTLPGSPWALPGPRKSLGLSSREPFFEYPLGPARRVEQSSLIWMALVSIFEIQLWAEPGREDFGELSEHVARNADRQPSFDEIDDSPEVIEGAVRPQASASGHIFRRAPLVNGH